MLSVTEENILEVYREALNNFIVDFIKLSQGSINDLYDVKTATSMLFMEIKNVHGRLRFAKSFDEFSNWREETERYRVAIAKFEVFGHI